MNNVQYIHLAVLEGYFRLAKEDCGYINGEPCVAFGNSFAQSLFDFVENGECATYFEDEDGETYFKLYNDNGNAVILTTDGRDFTVL